MRIRNGGFHERFSGVACPLFDHGVVKFPWWMLQHYKLRNRQTKWALRQVLYRYVPKELIERPEMGFGNPIGRWLLGPLRESSETLLDETCLRQEGYFIPAPIRKK